MARQPFNNTITASTLDGPSKPISRSGPHSDRLIFSSCGAHLSFSLIPLSLTAARSLNRGAHQRYHGRKPAAGAGHHGVMPALAMAQPLHRRYCKLELQHATLCHMLPLRAKVLLS